MSASLGLGTWRRRGESCRLVVLDAIDMGYRHVDTAKMYGNEPDIGAAVRESGVSRSELRLTTKLWDDTLQQSRVAPAIEDSLRALAVDYLDIVHIHWPSHEVSAFETLEELEALKNRGLIGELGVSNFSLEQTVAVCARFPVTQVQIEYHPYWRPVALLELAAIGGLSVTSYCPLAEGVAVRDPMVRFLAAARQCTPAQLVLRWLLDKGLSVIPGASSQQHLRENLAALQLTRLTTEETREMESIRMGTRLVKRTIARDDVDVRRQA